MHSYLGHVKGISSEEVIVFYDGNMYEIPRPVRCKIEKNICQRKIITHKTVFTWFGNLLMSTELQGFHYSQKNTKCGSTIFFS